MNYDQFYKENSTPNNLLDYLEYISEHLAITNKFLVYKTNDNMDLIQIFEQNNVKLLEDIAAKLDELIIQIDE